MRGARFGGTALVAAIVTIGALSAGAMGAATPASGATSLPAGAQDRTVTVANPMIPLPTNNSEASAYMTVRNHGRNPAVIVKASVPSTVAQMTMPMKEVLHGQTETMVNVARIVVPAKRSFRLAPGGYHIMLDGLQTTLVVGQRVPITLTLRNGSTISFSAPVVPLSKAFGEGGVAPSTGGRHSNNSASGTTGSMKGMKGMGGMKGMKGMKGMG